MQASETLYLCHRA